SFVGSFAGSSPNSIWIFSDHLNNRSEEHTSELQSHLHLVCRLLLEKSNHPANAARDNARPAGPGRAGARSRGRARLGARRPGGGGARCVLLLPAALLFFSNVARPPDDHPRPPPPPLPP